MLQLRNFLLKRIILTVFFAWEFLCFTDFDNALREFERVLKPNGKIIMSFNGIGYLIMKFILGISFFKWKELSYSLHGFINSILYWLYNFKFGYAVLNYSVMKKLLKKNNFKLEKCFIHLDMEDQFMEEKFLFTTNYLIVGEKYLTNNQIRCHQEN